MNNNFTIEGAMSGGQNQVDLTHANGELLHGAETPFNPILKDICSEVSCRGVDSSSIIWTACIFIYIALRWSWKRSTAPTRRGGFDQMVTIRCRQHECQGYL